MKAEGYYLRSVKDSTIFAALSSYDCRYYPTNILRAQSFKTLDAVKNAIENAFILDEGKEWEAVKVEFEYTVNLI